jgi:hypothetical protein
MSAAIERSEAMRLGRRRRVRRGRVAAAGYVVHRRREGEREEREQEAEAGQPAGEQAPGAVDAAVQQDAGASGDPVV